MAPSSSPSPSIWEFLASWLCLSVTASPDSTFLHPSPSLAPATAAFSYIPSAPWILRLLPTVHFQTCIQDDPTPLPASSPQPCQVAGSPASACPMVMASLPPHSFPIRAALMGSSPSKSKRKGPYKVLGTCIDYGTWMKPGQTAMMNCHSALRCDFKARTATLPSSL